MQNFAVLGLTTFLLTRPSEVLNSGDGSTNEQSCEEVPHPVKVIEDLIVLLLSILKGALLLIKLFSIVFLFFLVEDLYMLFIVRLFDGDFLQSARFFIKSLMDACVCRSCALLMLFKDAFIWWFDSKQSYGLKYFLD